MADEQEFARRALVEITIEGADVSKDIAPSMVISTSALRANSCSSAIVSASTAE